MRKFKLIKEYPNSPKLGTVIENGEVLKGHWYTEECEHLGTIEPFNHPEFWEEIEELCVPAGTRFKTKVGNYYTIESIKDNKVKVVWDQGYLNYSISMANTLFECGDWIKVEDKEYEILSYYAKNISGKGDNYVDPDYIWYETYKGSGKWSRKGHITKPYDSEEISNHNGYAIHSIKRLSDGEVFQLGDKVKDPTGSTFTISKFYLDAYDNHLLANDNAGRGHISITKIEKVKPTPFFTTKDGVELHKGDKYFQITNNFKWVECTAYDESNFDDTLIIFSTKKAAEEYIDNNKPQYSLNDVKEAYKEAWSEWGMLEILKNLKR